MEGLQCKAIVRYILPDIVHLCAFMYAGYMFRYKQSGPDQLEVSVCLAIQLILF